MLIYPSVPMVIMGMVGCSLNFATWSTISHQDLTFFTSSTIQESSASDGDRHKPVEIYDANSRPSQHAPPISAGCPRPHLRRPRHISGGFDAGERHRNGLRITNGSVRAILIVVVWFKELYVHFVGSIHSLNCSEPTCLNCPLYP